LISTRADAQAQLPLVRLGVARQRADELLLLPLDARLPPPDGLGAPVPVHDRHLDVQEDEVVQPRLHLREGLPAVLGHVHHVPLPLEGPLQVAAHGVRVVRDQHAARAARRQLL
jgi:hypothetical protein